MTTPPSVDAALAFLQPLPDEQKLAVALMLIAMLPKPADNCPVCGTACAPHTLATAYAKHFPDAPDAFAHFGH
jgi:hypothetical protein